MSANFTDFWRRYGLYVLSSSSLNRLRCIKKYNIVWQQVGSAERTVRNWYPDSYVTRKEEATSNAEQ